MIDVGIVGLGKMGLSHLAVFNAHPDVNVAAIVDPTKYLLDIIGKYSGIPTFTSYQAMLDAVHLDAVVIATPSAMHADMVRTALQRDIHVFCEKPLFLQVADGDELSALARERDLVTQVGYHNRFVASFAEAERLVRSGALGQVRGALAEAYGPVVLKPAGSSWRSRRGSGGGCLYDYAAHPIDLLVWYLGEPTEVKGRLTTVFSRDIDDEVTATFGFAGGASATLNVNWSDESQRKMTTRMTLWGTHGRLFVDRQELQLYLASTAPPVPGYEPGWNVRYTTDLTEAPWYYLRGEEYSAQVDAFVARVAARQSSGLNGFDSACATDRVIAAIIADAEATPTARPLTPGRPTADAGSGRLTVGRRRARRVVAQVSGLMSRAARRGSRLVAERAESHR